MSTRESRLLRGRRRGRELTTAKVTELRGRRVTLGIGQPQLARELGLSVPQLWRLEANQVQEITVVRLSEMASVLGLELSMSLHELGDPIRDKGHIVLGRRFEDRLSDKWQVTNETLLPMPGDQRAWDKLLRLKADNYRVGVDLETRIRDVQALTRRTRMRERDGGVDAILIVLSDSSTNRRLVEELRLALGPEYATPPRQLLGALRAGRRLPGSGVVLL
jgi:transcriptional regulator with XRE-family HTH domain